MERPCCGPERGGEEEEGTIMETSFPQRIVTPDTPIQPFPQKSLYTHNYQNTSDTLKHSFTVILSILKVLTRALFLLTKQDICISFLVFLIKIVFAIQYSESVCLQINIQSGFSADLHNTRESRQWLLISRRIILFLQHFLSVNNRIV